MRRAARGASVAMIAALLSSGCGGDPAPETARAARAERGVPAAASQDRLPGARPPTAQARNATDTDGAGAQACRTQIIRLCTQASIQSEAKCEVASCERVAGFWVLRIPPERVDEVLRRRGY